MIIGLSGYARAGKDTVADVLANHGYTAIAFADVLRDCAYALNPIVDARPESSIYLQDVINSFTWDNYKESPYGPEIRRILQRFGTEVGREILGESIWVDTAMKKAAKFDKVVFTDCRFLNEATVIRESGGQVWRVNRPGVQAAKSPDGSVHSSETALDNYDFDTVVSNDGTLDDLVLKVEGVLAFA